MTDEESVQVRQENEFQVLQSIFADEIRDVRPLSASDKVWSPVEVVITLTPQGSMNPKANHVRVDLRVKCSSSYPEIMPQIELESPQGLSKVKLMELEAELRSLAGKSVGEVMILQLAQHVQTYLRSHNHPRFQSFYEEMMSNKKQQMETREMESQRQRDLVRQKEERQRKAIDDEIQKKQDELKEEARLRRKMARRRASGDGSASDGQRRNTNSSISSQDAHLCRHDSTSTCRFRSNNSERTIQRGRCLGHGLRGSVTFVGVDAATGDPVTVTEWVLRWDGPKRRASESESVQKEMRAAAKLLSGIGRELSSLYKLEHENLVRCLDFNYYQESDKIVVQLLQELVIGVSTSAFLSRNIPLDYALLRHLTAGTAQALAYLHGNHVVHRDLRDSCVYLESCGGVKVSDYCADARLAELYDSVNGDLEDLKSPPNGRIGKNEDVFKLGLLVLSLAQGETVTDPERRTASSIPAEMRDFLDKCLHEDEGKRWTSAALLDHDFVRCPVGRHPRSPAKDKFVFEERRELPEEDGSDIPNLIPEGSENSRLRNEFKVLKWLGRGAFGDVLMVHNKLDAGIYAIKRIILNPHNKQLNRKITREVKLLSRLNHENVVRYFNSWIESSAVESNRKVAVPVNGIDWKMPYKDGDSSSCSSTDENLLKTPFLESDSSDDIVFEGGSNDEADELSESPSSLGYGSKRGKACKTIVQVMYIQMEFCEKSTLRNAIDTDLYRDEERMWRLFREIVEGLSHIHQQGMIHRDLKPVNIFLDSSDHVKIGDFGLATTSKVAGVITNAHERADSSNASLNLAAGEGSMTGCVGTALYVAPELRNACANLTYNQKVDIYSLGIILFEMCTRPLSTGMERVKVIGDVRGPEIALPPDFDDAGSLRTHAKLLKWLLDHDPRKRPTSLELLQSDLLPPPQMEETELREMIRHTISNSQSKAFKHMVSSLLNQDVPAAADATYNIDLRKCGFQEKACLAHDYVCSSLVKLFELHGAVPVHTPLLMPKSPLYDGNEYCVNLVDHGGGVVSLPYDLRVPFAKLVARCHVTNLKRYSIAPVYRERKVFGCQPRKLNECAFDIVTSSPASLVPDAEVLVVAGQVLDGFPSLCGENRFVRLNHTSLLKAILLYCGIPEEKHRAVYGVLGDAKATDLTRFQVQTQLASLCLAEHAVATLYRFTQTEGSLKRVYEELKAVTKKRDQAASLAQQGLHEIEMMIAHAQDLGLRVPVAVSPGMMVNVERYSGVFFQVMCETAGKRRKANKLEVLAAGGRYDNLISTFLINPSHADSRESCPRAVGVSFEVEKIVSSVADDAEFQVPSTYSVHVCSLGHSSLSTKDTFQVARDLWAAGIRARLQYNVADSLMETQEQCRLLSVPHIVIVKDGDCGFVRLQSLERNTFVEKKVSSSELTEHLLKLLSAKCEPQEHASQPCPKTENPRGAERAQGADVPTASFGNCNIGFVTVDKLVPNSKRRYEAQIMSTLSQVVQHFSPKVHVEVLAVELPALVIKTLAVDLEFESEHAFDGSISGIIDKHLRHKKYLTRLLDQIHAIKFEKKKPILVLYSLSDCAYKVLM